MNVEPVSARKFQYIVQNIFTYCLSYIAIDIVQFNYCHKELKIYCLIKSLWLHWLVFSEKRSNWRLILMRLHDIH